MRLFRLAEQGVHLFEQTQNGINMGIGGSLCFYIGTRTKPLGDVTILSKPQNTPHTPPKKSDSAQLFCTVGDQEFSLVSHGTGSISVLSRA